MAHANLTRQRITLLVAIVATCVLAALAVRSAWPGILRQRFLEQLRADPSRLFEFRRSSDPDQLAALEEFLDERQAKDLVFQLYLEEYENTEWSWNVFQRLENHRKHDTVAGFLALSEKGIQNHFRSTRQVGGGNHGSMSSPSKDPQRRRDLLELIDICVGEEFKYEKLPGIRFRIERPVDGLLQEPRWSGDPPAPPPSKKPRPHRFKSDVRHVCLFRIGQP